MYRKNKLIVIFSVILFSGQIFAQSKGETLFKENNAKDAVEVLEYEILNGQITANTYNFLGLGYYQLGDYAKSIDAFNRGIKNQPSISKILIYNQGNTYYAMKDYTSAINCYSEVLKEDPVFYDAKLNRANALLMANQLMNAREEYIDYLVKCPDDPQRPEIEALIKALTDEIKRREEEEAKLAELEKAKWEEVDANIEDENKIVDAEPEKSPEWEKVDSKIPEEKTVVKESEPEKKPEWEQIEEKIAEKKENAETKNLEPVKDEWEQIDHTDKNLAKEYEKIEDEVITESWQNLSDEDADELRELDERSKEEYLRWLEEQKRLKEEKLAEEKRKKEEEISRQQYNREEEERLYREKLMEEMQRAENERKQKLLEDVANSLQNAESTNMSAGLDDMIDYDHEGELD